MLRQVTMALLVMGSPASPAPQEGAPLKRNSAERLNELRKELSSSDGERKRAAIVQLGEEPGVEPIYLLARMSVSGSPDIRVEAVKALGRHRDPIAVRALDNCLGENIQDTVVSKACLDALANLDMCKGIPVLIGALWVEKCRWAEDALRAIRSIGCPEAAPGLLVFLKTAEHEERKPDSFDDGDGGTEENRNKNKALAALAQNIRDTLCKVTGQSFTNAGEAAAWLEAHDEFRLTSLFLCESAGKTFDIPWGHPKRCPYADQLSHRDLMLKHRRP